MLCSWSHMPCVPGKTPVFLSYFPPWIPERPTAPWINSFLEAGVQQAQKKAPFVFVSFLQLQVNTVDREEGIQWAPSAIILVLSSASNIRGPVEKEI